MNSAPLLSSVLPRPLRRLAGCVAVLVLFLAGVAQAQAQPPADYTQTVAAAKTLAAKHSWAKARGQYRAALALAPDAEAKRWCELWLLEADWRAEPMPDWRTGEEWKAVRLASFERLLKPYEKGAVCDDYWQAVLEARARFHDRFSFSYTSDGWTDRLTVADWLAEQGASEPNLVRYIAFLRRLVDAIGRNGHYDNAIRERLIRHVVQAQAAASNDEDRAWACWQSARLIGADGNRPLAERQRQWAEAVAAAKGQSTEFTVRTEELLWRIRLCAGEPSPERPKPDYAGWAKEIDALRQQAEQSPRSEDHECARALLALQRLWAQSKLELPIPKHIKLGEPVRLNFGAYGVKRIDVSVYRHRLESIEASAKTCDGTKDNDLESLLEEARELVVRQSVELHDADSMAWQQGEIAVAQSLPAGIYTFEAEGVTASGPLRLTETVLVGGVQAVTLKVTEGRTDFFVFDGSAEHPVVDATVRGLLLAEKGKTHALEARTDSEGRVSVDAIAESDGFQGSSVIAFVGDRPLLAKLRRATSDYRERLVADLFLDRPIYRPGETVRWKLILRERRDGRFHLPQPDASLRLIVAGDEAVLVEKQEIVFDAFGTAQGEVFVPAATHPGSYRFHLIRGEGEEDDDNRDLFRRIWVDFRVDNYVAPQVVARAELSSGVDSLQPGKEVVFEVGADYLSGGPVIGATIACTFKCWNYWTNSWRREGADKAPWRVWADEMEKKVLTATTGADGRARIAIRIPEDLPDGASGSLEGRVMPEGLPSVEFARTLGLQHTGRFAVPADSTPGLHYAEVGEEVVFALGVYDGLNRPAVFSGRAVLIERQWSEIWRAPDGRIVDERGIGAERRKLKLGWGDDLPKGWVQLHADYRETEVAETDVRTSSDGKLKPSFRLARSGLYGVRLRGLDGEVPVLGVAQFGATVLVPDSKMGVPGLPPDCSAIALPPTLTREGAFRVLAVVPEDVPVAWLTLRGEDEAKSIRFTSAARATWVDVAHLPRMDRRAVLELAAVGGRSSVDEVRRLELPDPAKQIDVQLSSAQEVLRPSETGTIRIHAQATANPEAPVGVAIAVWDDALAQFAERSDDGSGFVEGVAYPFATCFECIGVDESQRQGTVIDPRLNLSAFSELARLGATLREFPGSVGGDDEEVVILSPFEVTATESTGYAATATLAGSRLNTELRGVAPKMSEVGAEKAKPEIEIRRRFAPTAFWAPTVVTDANGEATVSFKYPDNLTQWRVVAYAVGADGNSFGMAKTFTRTSLPFQARLNLPRCFVAGDTAEAGAALLNRTDTAANATATLEVSGAASQTGLGRQAVALLAGRGDEFAVPAQGEAHAGWEVRAEKPGTAEFTLKAWTEAESDGMALTLPVLEDGILQPTAASGRLARGEQVRELLLPLPEPLDPARTTARVQLTGSHAATMLDALPYLVDYPYGCVEQTMSRFLPAVVVKRTLGELGFDAAAVEARILGRETPADVARREKTAGLDRLDEVIAKSVARLGEAQRNDGGFGWWPGAQQTDLWMTAYVAWGLELARTAGVAVPDELVGQTRAELMRYRVTGNESVDTTAWMLAALAAGPAEESEAKLLKKMFAGGYAEREQLSATGRACLALAAAKLGTPEERAVLVRNLENGAVRAESENIGDTVHWGSTANYWRASDGATESTALTLLALLELEPQHALVEPAMNWLVLNRRSGRWESTRDTAFAVLALSKFLQVRGEVAEESEVEVLADGSAVGRVTLNRMTLLAGPATLVLPTAQLRGGANRIALRRVRGTGPIYAVALAEAWATGDTVKPAGHQAEVTRGFVRRKAMPTLIGTLRIDPEPMANGGATVAGEEVQAVVTVTVPNELEYVMVEVPKPAGCEPLNALSGWDARIRRVTADPVGAASGAEPTARSGENEGLPIYREEHDDKSVFFLDRLEAGTWEIRFGMRAVTPGIFRALPVQVEAMYVPEIRANSDARRVRIERR